MKNFNEDLCMRHSYNLLLGKKTLDELIEETAELTLMFNPARKYVKMEDDLYDTLIEYFTYTEEYEKCAELLKAKSSL
ncbi:MAG: hypothetical protein Unbinned6224contig1000_21 [Prokaryotic dsDNA virus sp.]|nr:MAG: hypothetical protein Unbinned6224contig1000_21 [Prokaryotic dsDNA virus sp.]|tara:strand:- start:9554 stop:9787 length:234 start_codon:yes stop_codon:yes gene_type:complete